MEKIYDLIIVGGGPAGLAAAIYAARYNVSCIVISRNMGGTAATAYKICNYPSYQAIKGFELMQKFMDQVKALNVPIIYEDVLKIERSGKEFIVTTDKKYRCKKIIFATGTERNRLNAIGEGKFLGKGVSYCATCDAAFFKNKTVAVIGGSNAALTAALLLAEYGNKVYIIYKKEGFFRPEGAWIDLIKKEKKIEVMFLEEVKEIIGDKNVEGIKLKSGKTLAVEGLFVEIGSEPKNDLLKNLKVKLNEKGYIITDKKAKTNVLGLFAAGDNTDNSLKQIVTAAGEGATAAYSVYQELMDIKRT